MISKTSIHLWENEKSSGKLFNLNLIDSSGEIKVTVFKEMVDRYFDKLEKGKIHYISNATVTNANVKFMTVQHNFELILTNDTEIEECIQDIGDIPKKNPEKIVSKISEIKQMSNNSIVNLIGVCYDVKSLDEITSTKTGKLLQKREIILIDKSKGTISVTFWNENAVTFNESKLRLVMSVLNGRVNEYLGKKSIAINRDTIVEFDQNDAEAVEMKNWFESQNNIISLNDVPDEQIKHSTINDVLLKEAESSINLLGICFKIGQLKSFIGKNNIEIKKRNITLIDTSKKPIIFTTWNSEATNFDSKYTNSIISLQNVQLKEKHGNKNVTHNNERWLMK